MPTFTSVDITDSQGNDVTGVVHMQQGFGLMLGFSLSSNFGLQGELNYLAISQQYSDNDLDRQVNLQYINVPVLFSVSTSKSKQFNLKAVAGPEFSFNIGAKTKSSGSQNSDTLNTTLVVSKGNVGFAYGGGLQFAITKNHNLFFDLGYRGYVAFKEQTTTIDNGNGTAINVKLPKARNGLYIGVALQF